jgi:hypothetical protein
MSGDRPGFPINILSNSALLRRSKSQFENTAIGHSRRYRTLRTGPNVAPGTEPGPEGKANWNITMNSNTYPSLLPPLLTGEELAKRMGFTGVTSSFRTWCKHMGISTVPRRSGKYDPKHVRDRLDIMQNIKVPATSERPVAEMSLVEQRRARREK